MYSHSFKRTVPPRRYILSYICFLGVLFAINFLSAYAGQLKDGVYLTAFFTVPIWGWAIYGAIIGDRLWAIIGIKIAALWASFGLKIAALRASFGIKIAACWRRFA
jgi:hypothetical protein